MAEGDLLWKFAGAVVIGGTVYFVATHPALMAEWVLWAAWQLRYYLLTVLILLTLALLVRRRRKQQTPPPAGLGIAAAAPAGELAAADPPVQRVEHTHIHLDGGRTPHPYRCPCQGKAVIDCEQPGDHDTHAACTAGKQPCPFPTDIQMEV